MKTFIQTDDGYIWEDVTDKLESLATDKELYILHKDSSESLIVSDEDAVNAIYDGNRIVIETNLTLIPKDLRVC